MVVVLGGVGNLLGTVLASFGIGIMTDLIELEGSYQYGQICLYFYQTQSTFLRPQVWQE